MSLQRLYDDRYIPILHGNIGEIPFIGLKEKTVMGKWTYWKSLMWQRAVHDLQEKRLFPE